MPDVNIENNNDNGNGNDNSVTNINSVSGTYKQAKFVCSNSSDQYLDNYYPSWNPSHGLPYLKAGIWAVGDRDRVFNTYTMGSPSWGVNGPPNGHNTNGAWGLPGFSLSGGLAHAQSTDDSNQNISLYDNPSYHLYKIGETLTPGTSNYSALNGQYNCTQEGEDQCVNSFVLGLHVFNEIDTSEGSGPKKHAMYAVGSDSFYNPTGKYACLTAEKEYTLDSPYEDAGNGTASFITTPNPNTYCAYPKLYISIDEYDYASETWDIAKSLLQIAKDRSCFVDQSPVDNDWLGWSGIVMHASTANDRYVGKVSSDDFTENGYKPRFLNIEPNAYNEAIYQTGQYNIPLSWNEDPNPTDLDPLLSPLNPLGGLGGNVSQHGNPGLTAFIEIPFTDSETLPYVGGIDNPRKFRARLIFIGKRNLEGDFKGQLQNNPGKWQNSSFVDDNEAHFDIDDMREMIRDILNNDNQIGGYGSMYMTAPVELEYGGQFIEGGSSQCLEPDSNSEIVGCMDECATNYNPDATIDSCNCNYCENIGPAGIDPFAPDQDGQMGSVNLNSNGTIHYDTNSGTPCNPILGFTSVSGLLFANSLLTATQGYIGNSIPFEWGDGFNSTPVSNNTYYPSITSSPTSWVLATTGIQPDMSQAGNCMCNGTVIVPQFWSLWDETNGAWVDVQNTALPPADQGFNGQIPVADVQPLQNNNDIDVRSIWQLQPATTYRLMYQIHFKRDVCPDCNGANNVLHCVKSIAFTTAMCIDDEEPQTIYVCECEDCDDHFTVTNVDCFGNNISDLIDELGPENEIFVPYEYADEATAETFYYGQCGCKEEDPPSPVECQLPSGWAQIEEDPSFPGNSILTINPSSNTETWSQFLGNGSMQVGVFLQTQAGNIISSSANFVNNYSSIGSAPPNFTEEIVILNTDSVDDAANATGPWTFQIEGLPPGNLVYTIYTLLLQPEGPALIDCEQFGNYYLHGNDDEPVNCGEPSGQFNVQATPESCVGAADGSALITQASSYPIGPFTFNYYSFDNSELIATDTVVSGGGIGTGYDIFPDGLAAGDYYVVIIDDNGCEYTEVISIGSPTPIIFSVVTTEVTVNGASDGTANVNNITGGIGPYITDWYDSNGNAVNNNALPEGEYTVSITDSNGCQTEQNVVIGQPQCVIAVYGTETNPTTSTANDGSISLSIVGGLAPYQIDWVGPNNYESNAATITGLAEGTYYVQVCSSQPGKEPCCGYASFTLVSGACITQENEELILDKVNEILGNCDCILPPVSNEQRLPNEQGSQR